ncbi:hypothetical protein M9978_20140 [Sphingomonas sp. MG17]|uniref:Uncharacterized protein n=1 Tax=Sphingomonas tagetis TaxID=2949092 RepID=A0A9X2KNF5_9SPHN|nr:hypothetical protein [Sphingomonas tagetis]MCP3732732.1 hypothetical protein [Sphingomonas tagetis]
MRARSRDKRSLDDLVLAMLARRRGGQRYHQTSWRALLAAELGAGGTTGLNDMPAGKLTVPRESAFGPCFTRQPDKRARPERGMSENSFLVAPTRSLDSFRHHAPQRAAGSRVTRSSSFQAVTAHVAHSAPNVLVDPQVTWVVKRAGSPVVHRYLVGGPTVISYK